MTKPKMSIVPSISPGKIARGHDKSGRQLLFVYLGQYLTVQTDQLCVSKFACNLNTKQSISKLPVTYFFPQDMETVVLT